MYHPQVRPLTETEIAAVVGGNVGSVNSLLGVLASEGMSVTYINVYDYCWEHMRTVDHSMCGADWDSAEMSAWGWETEHIPDKPGGDLQGCPH